MIKNIFTSLWLLIVSGYAGIGTGSFGGGTVSGGGTQNKIVGPGGAEVSVADGSAKIQDSTGIPAAGSAGLFYINQAAVFSNNTASPITSGTGQAVISAYNNLAYISLNGGAPVTLGGADLASPGPIGATTPNAGSFSNVIASGLYFNNSKVIYGEGVHLGWGGAPAWGSIADVNMSFTGFIGWAATSGGGSIGTTLTQDAASILAQRNGEADQTFRLYSKYVDDSNYSRLSIKSTDTGIMFDSEAAGTGTARDFSFNRDVTDTYKRSGSGSPQGAVVAPVGAFYSRTDGGAGTSFYVKESGSGNTGWVAK